MLKKWLKRAIDGRGIEGDIDLQNIQYNSMSGAQKNISVGPALEYVGPLTAATKVEPGSQLYILNTGALAYVTMGDSGVSLVAGPAEHTFPVEANTMTPYSAADYTHVIGTAALHLYILRDESKARK